MRLPIANSASLLSILNQLYSLFQVMNVKLSPVVNVKSLSLRRLL